MLAESSEGRSVVQGFFHSDCIPTLHSVKLRGQKRTTPTPEDGYSMKRERFMLPFLLLSLLVAGPLGCKKPKKVVLTKEQEREIQEHVLESAPTPQIPLNTQFGDSVRLLGMDAPKTAVRPGQKVEFVYYWEVLKAPGTTWKIFGHLEGPGKRQILDHHPIRNLYPMSQWKAGQFIVDKQTFTLDRGFKGDKATLWLGFFDEVAWSKEKKNVRLPVVVPGQAKAGKGDRAQVVTLKLKGTQDAKASRAPKVKPGKYTVGFITEPVTLDGKLDDAVWRNVKPTRNFIHTDGKAGNGSLATTVKMVYDNTHLYLGFHVKDADIQSPFTSRDDTLWKADVVEFFFRTGKSGDEYVELQVNPANVLFDALFTSHRKPRWEEAAKKLQLNLESAVHVDGTLNADGEDKSWSVELRVPFAELSGLEGAPAAGDTWQANLYRIDNKGPRSRTHQRTWSPVGNDFHKLDGAGTLVFGRQPAKAAPAPEKPKAE